MKIDPVKFYSAVTAVAVIAVLAGQFAIKGYFERRGVFSSDSAAIADSGRWIGSDDDEQPHGDVETLWTPFEPDAALNTALDAGQPAQAFSFADGPQFVGGHRLAQLDEAQPANRVDFGFAKPTVPDSEAHAADAGSPERFDIAMRHLAAPAPSRSESADVGVPEALAAPDDAAPLPLQSPCDETLPLPDDDTSARELVDRELPHASREERNVWLQELKGLPENMVRDLLRLRRNFGSDVKIAVPQEPGLVPSERPDLPERPHPGAPRVDAQASLVRHPRPTAHQWHTEPWFESTLAAIEQARGVLLNNIANANTVGFKRATLVFADLPYQQIDGLAGSFSHSGGASSPVSIGMGTILAGTRIDISQGSLRRTDRELDVAIDGDGFLQLEGDDELLYTRAGRLSLTSDGLLGVRTPGATVPLEPACSVPPESRSIRIEADGTVCYQVAASSAWHKSGHIETARFANPEELQPRGASLFAAPPAAAAPHLARAGVGGHGPLRQGFLEESNTDCAVELENLKRLGAHVDALDEAAAFMPHLTGAGDRIVRKHTDSVQTVRPDADSLRRR